MCEEQQVVTAKIVPDSERLQELPNKLGQQFMHVEFAIYSFMENLCGKYNGGFWEFYSLSNGGFYMAPTIGNNLKISWVGNYFEGTMSSDAAGIVACLFAYSYIAEKGSNEAVEMYHKLRSYVHYHEEQDLIFKAID